MNILVVDDCPRIATAIGNIFSNSVRIHHCAKVHSYESAIQKLNSGNFHVVMIDYDLRQDKNGIDLCRWIRGRDKDCIIIFLTAYASPDIIEQAFDAGAHDFLHKPFSREEVRLKVFHWWEFLKCGKNSLGYLEYHGLKFVFKSNELFTKGQRVPLTKSFKRLMLMFMSQPETLITHDVIQRELWGDYDMALKSRNIHERIGGLKRALPRECQDWVRSVRGEGYILKF